MKLNYRVCLLAVLLITGLIAGCGGGGHSSSTSTGIVSGSVTVDGIFPTSGPEMTAIPGRPGTSIKVRKIAINRGNFELTAAVPNQKLVRFRSGLSLAECRSILSRSGLKLKQKISGSDRLYLVEADPNSAALKVLQQLPAIESVQDNYIYHALYDISDPGYTNQPDLPMMYFNEAWDLLSPAPTEVIVAVIDSGVDRNHPDLVANLTSGRNFVGTDEFGDDQYDDENGHGTHVAGIIAAVANGSGVVGIACNPTWNIRIMPIRILDASGSGTSADLINAIYWAVNNHARIINLSLGAYIDDVALQTAVDTAVIADVTVVAAVGNDGISTVMNPAGYDSVIAVAALDSNGSRASYSNYGPEVDLCAPGGDEIHGIYNTYPNDNYASLYGTSMACPHITGLTALLYAQGIDTPAAVRERLQGFVFDKGTWGRDDYSGYGMPDAYATLFNSAAKGRNVKIFTVKANKTIDARAFIYPDASGNYLISNAPTGTNYICAFLDQDMDGRVDLGDRFAYISGVIISKDSATNLPNINLITPPGATGQSLSTYLNITLP